ncbi:hypothetical protein LX87_00331 [Larkinella arboricola]|uniref:Uncharacterized protein n=1 Tax=Larkinella arboricola TaxID=643671 RepID=A0A327X656_LARAB|nr:hypothetical protein [Larkinella arboricola]RAK02211.1 hypothetical protein LX87_00331 [Larkinella arboricola]
MSYQLHESEIHFDFIENLHHFQGVQCKLTFKPHQRRRIIKLAKSLSKEAFQRFKAQIDLCLDKYSVINTTRNSVFEELKQLNNHDEISRYLDNYRGLYVEYESLKGLLKSTAEGCFRTYIYSSPPMEFFSTSFHTMKKVLIEATNKDVSFKLDWSDTLPVRKSQWNTQEKLFTFLLARKRYFFDCYNYIKGFHGTMNFIRDPYLSEEQDRILSLYLLSNNYFKPSDLIPFYYFLHGYDIHIKITWLKSATELAFLVYQLNFEKFYLYRYYDTIGNMVEAIAYYFQNAKQEAYNKRTLKQYFRQLIDNEEDGYYSKKVKPIKIFIEHLKVGNHCN